MALPEEKKYTVNDFYAMFSEESNSDIHELIDGVVYDMASPNIRHQAISGDVFWIIRSFISSKGGKCRVFASPTDVKLDDYTIVVPDIFVACDPDKFDDRKYNGAPDWVIEIVSSDRKHDFLEKLSLYYYAGVREYWIIDPKFERTAVYFFEKNELFPEIFTFDKPVPVNIYDGELVINISEIK